VRVLIDTTYARRAPLSGTGIYIRQLCAELSTLPGVELIEVANRRRRPPAGGGLGSVRNLTGDVWWALAELPRLARRHGAEVLHHPLPAALPGALPGAFTPRPGLGGLGPPTGRAAQVVTVVDLAFERLPDHFARGYRTYAHHTHRAGARAAAAVIAISETTAADAREFWGVPAERIVVAHLGPGQDLGGACPDPEQDPGVSRPGDPRHFLYVGDAEPRKNLPTLLDAYRIYRATVPAPLDLVLAGSAVAQMPGVRVESGPGAERLGQLYRGAAALLQPSLYEGFGLTALEAMSAGTPVLAARSPGLVEICADAARYADPRDAAGFAAQMTEIAADPGLRADLHRRGIRRAGNFSWEKCARAHLDAYSLALGQ
jgi:glycosyltransferase involved in cell wall biosynthesis